MLYEIKQDFKKQLFEGTANQSFLRALYFFFREPSAWTTIVYRLGHAITKLPKLPKLLLFPLYMIFLWMPVRYITGIEIFPRTKIGAGFCIKHWGGIFINHASEIGSNVTIFNNVTLGCDFNSPLAPKIGDGVKIGVGAKLIGGITVGSNSIIGAGSIVVKDVPANVIVAGNPARIIRTLDE